MRQSEWLLHVVGLKKFFPITKGVFRRHIGDIRAVNGVDIAIATQEVVGIVGESGCGKSTVGRTAIRLYEPTAGKIFFHGEDLLQVPKSALSSYRKKMQIVFQDPYASLNPRKTVYEIYLEILQHSDPHGVRNNHSDMIVSVVENVGLRPDALQLYPHEFSGGQQQRICIGRSLLMNPELIILDEAVSALDVSVQAQILNLLVDLKEKNGLSYFFISHDLSVVKYISDRIVIMYLGKVVESATTKEIFSHPHHPYTKILLSSVPKEHPDERREAQSFEGEVPSMLHYPQGCPFHTRCPVVQNICLEQFPERKCCGEGHEYYCIH